MLVLVSRSIILSTTSSRIISKSRPEPSYDLDGRSGGPVSGFKTLAIKIFNIAVLLQAGPFAWRQQSKAGTIKPQEPRVWRFATLIHRQARWRLLSAFAVI